MKLTQENVKATVIRCMFEAETDQNKLVIVEGATGMRIGFHKDKLNEAVRIDVSLMLCDLPCTYFKGEGEGGTWLELGVLKDGMSWTFHPKYIDSLCMLAIAVGVGRWTIPREMWGVLPHGAPYFTVDLGTPLPS